MPLKEAQSVRTYNQRGMGKLARKNVSDMIALFDNDAPHPHYLEDNSVLEITARLNLAMSDGVRKEQQFQSCSLR